MSLTILIPQEGLVDLDPKIVEGKEASNYVGFLRVTLNLQSSVDVLALEAAFILLEPTGFVAKVYRDVERSPYIEEGFTKGYLESTISQIRRIYRKYPHGLTCALLNVRLGVAL